MSEESENRQWKSGSIDEEAAMPHVIDVDSHLYVVGAASLSSFIMVTIRMLFS